MSLYLHLSLLARQSRAIHTAGTPSHTHSRRGVMRATLEVSQISGLGSSSGGALPGHLAARASCLCCTGQYGKVPRLHEQGGRAASLLAQGSDSSRRI